MPAAELIVRDVSKHFGGVRAVDGLSFTVEPGIICGLIGPNGSGKTTTLNLITGMLPLTGGQVEYGGHVISKLKRSDIARRGIGRTFQNLRLFPTLTVLDHVVLSRFRHAKSSVLAEMLGLPAALRDDHEATEVARAALERVGLAGSEKLLPGELPYGRRRLLEIARALATDASLLCLDEPAAGMAESEIGDLIRLIRDIRDTGVSVLLIEHRMSLVMEVCEKVVVLNYGKKISEGTCDEISCDAAVIQAYLGTRHSGRTA